ncbi:MAG: o-succinylbenzoate--CoA ligase [Halioglobus sp.]|nr:o-succinylbenzoate--CoA ligase [Halioglobus sp.]
MSTEINIGKFLATRAFLNPNREALVDVGAGRRMTYAQLNERANRCCAALRSIDVTRGDRVALLATNGHPFAEVFFGCAKTGLVVMPLNWRLTATELSFILRDGGARTVVFDAGFAPVVDELRAMGSDVENWICIGDGGAPDYAADYETLLSAESPVEPETSVDADDNLFIMYTSGTTGNPKGVVHTHETVFWALLTTNATADSRFDDRYLLMLPMFHVGALSPMILCIYNGSTVVMSTNFDPEQAWELIDRERISTTLAVPVMLNFMLQVNDLDRFDRSSLRYITSGAAPVPVSLIERYLAMGLQINQVYGMTETCGPACMITSDDAVNKIGSAGKAFFHTQVRVVNDAGEDQPPGEPGEILVRGPHIMKEYWNRPDATRETIVDGWLHTGDIATWDEERFVTIADRKKDMIISGGENVYPAEVENVLLQHSSITDAAVIGQPSERWGESPLAVIVCGHEQLTEADVITHCEGKLARYKRPVAAVFVDVIPRNPSGKILKRLLREQFPGPAAE